MEHREALCGLLGTIFWPFLPHFQSILHQKVNVLMTLGGGRCPQPDSRQASNCHSLGGGVRWVMAGQREGGWQGGVEEES